MTLFFLGFALGGVVGAGVFYAVLTIVVYRDIAAYIDRALDPHHGE